MNNFQITSLLSKVKLSETEKQDLSNALSVLCKDKEKQAEFFAYCKKWKLAPWTFSQLKSYNLLELFSEETQKDFSNFYEKIRTENEDRNDEAVKILKEFKKNNVDVIILKGNLFIHTVYKDTGYKKMNDFDILIHQKDWFKVQEIYFSMNYIPLGFGWSGEKQEAAKFSHTGISFISPDYKCITGTQWGLKSPTSKYTVDNDDLWQTAQEFDFYGEKVKQLSPEYNILHLILHMGIYKCGTRDFMDVYNLFLSEYSVNEDKLAEIIIKSNAKDKAYFTFLLSNTCANVISNSILDKIKPQNDGFIMKRLNSRLKMFEETGDLHHSYNDYFHEVEMTVFYFNLFPKFHTQAVLYLKLIWLILWPSKEIVHKLSDITEHSSFYKKVLARIKAPYFVLGLTAEEIGWGITFILLSKFFVDTILSLKNYFVKKESYFDYLKKQGINPDDIKNAVKKIQ